MMFILQTQNLFYYKCLFGNRLTTLQSKVVLLASNLGLLHNE
uniref:Uncharacterized protein n=1 Tax=Arundo donax TaxID=35708 RepID=A0A0A9A0F0_ARUDO